MYNQTPTRFKRTGLSLPEPYYQDDSCTIYHGDCRELLPLLERESADVVLTDPPYFRVKDEGWDRTWKSEKLFLAFIGECLDEYRRLLKSNGSLYLFAGHDLAPRIEEEVRVRFHVLNRIRWIKDQGWHKKAAKEELRSFLSPWEEVVFAEQYGDRYADASKALHKDVYAPLGRYIQQERIRAGWSTNDLEIALGYIERNRPERGSRLCGRWEEGSSLPTKEAYERMRGVLNRRGGEYLRREYEELRREYEELRRPFFVNDEASDVWHFPTVSPYPGKHPCEKPLSLVEYAIRVSSKPGATVLDSFVGSGTTAVACKNLGRRCVGIESDESYCETTARRLSQEILPLDIA